jgi:hypothetical protein
MEEGGSDEEFPAIIGEENVFTPSRNLQRTPPADVRLPANTQNSPSGKKRKRAKHSPTLERLSDTDQDEGAFESEILALQKIITDEKGRLSADNKLKIKAHLNSITRIFNRSQTRAAVLEGRITGMSEVVEKLDTSIKKLIPAIPKW